MQQTSHGSPNSPVRLRAMAALAALATTLSCLAFNIRGYVADPQGEILPQASVRLLKAKDSTFVAGQMTDNNGRFNISGIGNGRYTIEVTYIGYSPLKKNVAVNGANLRLDTLKMADGGISLSEVKVTGTRTPVKVMEDTDRKSTRLNSSHWS